MKKELDYIRLDSSSIGGNQDWLPDWDMYYGGCAAVTACDLCLYLAARDDFPQLSGLITGFENRSLTREVFIKLSRIIKPYISPRNHGVDFLEIYLEGLAHFWRDIGYYKLRLEGLAGTVDFQQARELVQTQINNELPVPYLMLRHRDSALGAFKWHWFNLTGYKYQDSDCAEHNCQICDNKFFVKAVTYGEAHWLDFRNLWETGHMRRGGLIKISPK